MIKLKLTREALAQLCFFTTPVHQEVNITADIAAGNFTPLPDHFNLIEIWEKASKKYLYNTKKSYKLGLSYAQAAALFNFTEWNENAGFDEYKMFVLQEIRGSLHLALTNYQKRYYGTATNSTAAARKAD